MRWTTLWILAAALAWAHYTWVAPVSGSTFEAGKAVKILISHGHQFPKGEEAVNASQVNLWVIAPSGARTELKAAVSGAAIGADFVPKESGVHRVAFTQDRGVMSRTPRGVKAGGRDKNPDATQSFRSKRIGVWHSGPKHQTLGLEAELHYANGAVQVLRRGKPLEGQLVQVVLAGEKEAKDVGKTGADGKIAYTPARQPMLLLADIAENPNGGVEERFSVSLYVP